MSGHNLESAAEVDQQAPKKRNWKGFIIRIIGSATVLALLYYFLPRDKLIQAFSTFSVEIWAAGISCYLCLHLIGVAKWRMLINAAGGDLSFAQAMRCYYYGLFGNTFLPSVVGGDLIRAGLAMKLTQSKSAVLMGSVVDRTIDSLGLALVAGIGALLIPMSLEESNRNIFWGFVAFLVFATLILLVILSFIPIKRLSFKWQRKIVKVLRSARLLARSWKKVIVALFAVVILQVTQVVMNSWLGRLALITNASFLTWMFVWPLAKLSAMAPLTQGGIGVREAVQGSLFIPFGVSMEKAVATGLMFQAIIICGNLLGGIVAMVMGQVSSFSSRTSPAISCGARRWTNYTAFSFGLTMFFVANTLMMAWGTGAISDQYLQWMYLIPGYGVDFTGSAIGFGYGMLIGGCLGWLLFYFFRLLGMIFCRKKTQKS